jgi:hypothetical protein
VRLAGLLALLLVVAAAPARAQKDAPPEPVLPPAPVYRSQVIGYRPSPEWTQDRSFTSTRFWRLDPGQYEVEFWWRTRLYREANTPADVLLQAEIEIGIAPHLQLDLYENVQFNQGDDGSRHLTQEGNQIELRIAIPSYYGQMFGNPVIYLEWHPRQGQPDRAEVRLLLGGAPTPRLYLVVNPYVEANMESTESTSVALDAAGRPILDQMGQPTLTRTSKYLADAEVGTTLAAGVRITDWLRLSAEMKIGGDMLGDQNNKLHFVWFLGPGFILKPLKNQRLKVMGTCLFLMPGSEGAGAGHDPPQAYEPLLIIGSQF